MVLSEQNYDRPIDNSLSSFVDPSGPLREE